VADLDRAVNAAQSLVKARQLEPADLARLYHSQAWLHLARHDRDAALHDVELAVEAETPPGNSSVPPENLVERGRLLYGCKRYQEAVAACDAALLLPGAPAEAHRWRAEALLQLQPPRYKEALQAYDAYLKAPGAAARRQGLAEVHQARGLVRARLGDYPRAIDDYNQALVLRPDSATHAYRGWAYLESKDPRLALADFQEAIRLNDGNADAYNGCAYACVKLGDYDQAIKDTRKAVDCAPKDPRTLWNAANVFAHVFGKLDTEGAGSPAAWEAHFQYQDEALRLLGQALAFTPAEERAAFWREKVQPDRDLDRIRRSPGYARLEVEYSRLR
jgi:tetratricopeptide (TPR) repeat protein